MSESVSRFEGLDAPAGDFHLLICRERAMAKGAQALLDLGEWLIPSKAQLAAEEWLLRHARMAEVVWVDEAAWVQYGSLLRNAPAAVVVLGTDHAATLEDLPPLLINIEEVDRLKRLYWLLRQTPSLRFALRRQLHPLSETLWRNWLIDGPVDSSYSLAIVNRELGRALRALGAEVFWSDPELLQRAPQKHFLSQEELARITPHPAPAAVHARNNYPPGVEDMGGLLNLYLNYAWEETGFPPEWIAGFNQRLDGMTVVSTLVRDILRNNGLRVPVAVTGNGVDHLPEPQGRASASGESAGAFTFVHISSCFPRKGIDVLLQAWGEAFTDADNVQLIIKTFPNPHNQTEAHLARLRQRCPRHAPVQLIMEDWPEEKIRALLQSADALVAPSRAEGFGMPLAEAMYYGVPVIATGWGGHRDFCTEETAWLIDYTFAAARSHVSTPESVWAEPDATHLATLLRTLVELPPSLREEKVRRAQTQVSRHYRWQRLAQHSQQFVQRLSEAPAFPSEPQVLWISTFNSRCGIAEYSRNLLKAFPEGQYAVLADCHSEPLGDDPPYVSRLLSWTDADVDTIVEAADEFDTVVLQHHHAFYSLSTLAEIVTRLKACDKQVLVTFHNTHPPHTGAGFDQLGLRQADRLLVHGVADLNRLKRAGLVDNVALLPHGIYEHSVSPERLEAHRQRLGLQGSRVIATFGFLMPHKGVAELVEAFAQLAQEDARLKLLLVNSFHPATPSEEEKRRLDQLVDVLGLEERVVRVHDYLPEHTAIELLSLAEVTAFPYRHTQESASGAVRMAIAAGRPIVVTPLPIFDDIAPIVRYSRDLSVPALAEALAETLQACERDGLEAVAEPVVQWAQRYGWQVLSERLWNLLVGLKQDAEHGAA